ncbi:type VII toxin-antitoxin system MntA family adenylyltransferase antitoxin [Salinibacter ruber]|uniref:type VII toxin-antitoxin system MntA family adenylyltransferase antitoxin n=1 Tax=Salinibacter ruber TaxID=146919 RepID=UPI0021693F16|nr:nucleotidyltransferase domain-containing protein [Salinibacter ruber]MCS4198079.1 putative nucleotidyltransferase [Salinibacter ruber]
MDSDERQRITSLLRGHERIRAAWVFGSVATGTAEATSDLDVAVLANGPLSSDEKKALIEQLAQETGRPVDLIDLQATHGPIVDRVLQGGTRLFCTDTTLYAELLKRWWLDRADWRPYRRRILKERREQWIGN